MSTEKNWSFYFLLSIIFHGVYQMNLRQYIGFRILEA